MLLNDLRSLIDSTLKTQNPPIQAVLVSNGYMPEDGNRNCAIFEYSGGASVFTMGSEDNGNSLEVCENLAFQVQSRTAVNGYEEARKIAEIIYRRLNGLKDYKNTTNPDFIYQHITAKQPPFHLGNDEHGRPVIACNFSAMRART